MLKNQADKQANRQLSSEIVQQLVMGSLSGTYDWEYIKQVSWLPHNSVSELVRNLTAEETRCPLLLLLILLILTLFHLFHCFRCYIIIIILINIFFNLNGHIWYLCIEIKQNNSPNPDASMMVVNAHTNASPILS